MKKYTMTYKNFAGALKYDCFEATTQREAIAIAKEKFEAHSQNLCGGFTLMDFYGNIIKF